MNNLHCVIMAGGSGTRFWPESRKSKPKQLLPLAGNKSLLVETINRVSNIFDESKINIVTSSRIKKQVKESISGFDKVNIIAEPKGRNTAPCIGYMAAKIEHYYNEDKQLIRVELPIKFGKLDGIIKEYYRNGRLFREIPMKNGIREGIERWYYENGNPMYEITYKDGIRDGLIKNYFKNGKIHKVWV